MWFSANILIVLLIKLKTLVLVTLINYTTNYINSILLLIFWYNLLAPVADLSKQSHLERYEPEPPEPFLPNTHPHNWFMTATAQLENFC